MKLFYWTVPLSSGREGIGKRELDGRTLNFSQLQASLYRVHDNMLLDPSNNKSIYMREDLFLDSWRFLHPRSTIKFRLS